MSSWICAATPEASVPQSLKWGPTKLKSPTMGKNQHVVPDGNDWAVQGEGNSRRTSVHDTQSQAIDAARDIARNQHSELLIHGRDGQIRARDSYGNDPYPPKN